MHTLPDIIIELEFTTCLVLGFPGHPNSWPCHTCKHFRGCVQVYLGFWSSQFPEPLEFSHRRSFVRWSTDAEVGDSMFAAGI